MEILSYKGKKNIYIIKKRWRGRAAGDRKEGPGVSREATMRFPCFFHPAQLL